MKSILIAGMGNISQGDAAFGCEVVRQLEHLSLLEEVAVMDFGSRSQDLAGALTNGYGTLILVDALTRGRPPGTLYLLEPDLNWWSRPEAATGSACEVARSSSRVCQRVFLVGCEPAVLKNENSEIRLSEKVEDAMPRALAAVELLVEDLLKSRPKTDEVRVAA